MTQTFKMREIGNTTLRAMKSAARLYRKMTGGDAVRATEYFFTVSVGLAIYDALVKKQKHGGFVAFERNLKKLLVEAGANTPGPKSKRIKNGICDVVIYDNKKRPRALIEVKGNLYKTSQAMADIRRIAKMLVTKVDDNSLQTGVFAFVSTKREPVKREPNATKTIERRHQSYNDAVEKLFSSNKKYTNLLRHSPVEYISLEKIGNVHVCIGVIEIWKAP